MPGSSKRLKRLAAWADEGKLRPTVAQALRRRRAGVRERVRGADRGTAGKVPARRSSRRPFCVGVLFHGGGARVFPAFAASRTQTAGSVAGGFRGTAAAQ